MASGDAAREAVKQRTQRGSSGLPKGVTKSGKKYQARINYRPEGKVKKELRGLGLGSFDSVEQAVQAVAAARAALNDGEDPFKQELVQRQARGQVRSPTSPVAGPLICSCLHRAYLSCVPVRDNGPSARRTAGGVCSRMGGRTRPKALGVGRASKGQMENSGAKTTRWSRSGFHALQRRSTIQQWQPSSPRRL